ncbi:UDP-N-acetylglucosamine--N-acetylmuramyl-(pentapeptide) pyrophosphoryl-undecaprenol N-acetylglucosamine transferase [Persephonella sp.]
MKKKAFISGGGTGGHFYPAYSVAEYLKEKGYEIHYFGTKNGIEGRKEFPADKKYLYDISGVRGKSVFSALKSASKLVETSFKISKIIKNENPDIILTFGGYASLPLGLGAFITRKRFYIHEQNSIPSYTNILLSKFAEKVFITFDYSKKYFPPRKTILTGYPLRKSLIEDKSIPTEEARKKLDIPLDKKVILIFGGSQGAKKLTEFGVKLADTMKKYFFIIITGKNFTPNKHPENCKLIEYTDRIGLLYKSSDAVISRAGAGSVTEVLFFSLPAVFIPYPYAASDHQFYNVNWLNEPNFYRIIKEEELTIDRLKSEVETIINSDRNKLMDINKKYSIMNTPEKIINEIKND